MQRGVHFTYVNQDQRKHMGSTVIVDGASEDAEIARVLRAHGKNPLAEEEAIKSDVTHPD